MIFRGINGFQLSFYAILFPQLFYSLYTNLHYILQCTTVTLKYGDQWFPISLALAWVLWHKINSEVYDTKSNRIMD